MTTSKKIKTVFFGTPDFALPSLQACFESSELLALVCQPDRPRGRGHKILPCETRVFANEKSLPSFSPSSLKKESPEKSALLSFLEKNKPDLFVVVAYGNLFPQSFLEMTSLGAINVHASLLPRWRGAAPIQRCLENGDKITGVCVQKMLLELDAGDVLSETRLSLQDEDALGLSQKLSVMGGETLRALLKELNSNPVLPVGKGQNALDVTFADKIKKEEGHYLFSWSAEQTLNKIRAFRAWPQVKVLLPPLGEIKLLAAKASPVQSSLSPGTLYLDNSKALLVCAKNSTLEIESLQPPGKAPISASSLLQNLAPNSGQSALRVLEISSSEKIKN